MAVAYIGLGSNLGDREANIRRAIKLIDQECVVLAVSGIYETEPVGLRGQPWFLNCVVEADTQLTPKKLLIFLKSVEDRLGRKRTLKDGPRTMDLDILFYGRRIVEDHDGLIIPHPRLHKRKFVLKPLADLRAGLVHPVLKKTMKTLLKELKTKDAVKLYVDSS